MLSLHASHLQPPHLANKKLQEPTDLLWLVLFHFELIKMLCLQFVFVGTLLFQRHLNKNYTSNRQIKRVAHFILCFEGILCSLIITNYIISVIYFLLIYLLQRMTDWLQLFPFVSTCFRFQFLEYQHDRYSNNQINLPAASVYNPKGLSVWVFKLNRKKYIFIRSSVCKVWLHSLLLYKARPWYPKSLAWSKYCFHGWPSPSW